MTRVELAAGVGLGRHPGPERVVLDGVGHMSFVEAPDAYLQAVRAFPKA